MLFVFGLEESLQNPKLGSPQKDIPLQNPCSLQSSNQGSLKCTLKKYHLNFKTSTKSQAWARLLPQTIPLQNPKLPGHAPYTLKKLYYEMALYNR